MKKNIWIILACLSIASIGFISVYFEKIIPFMHLTITMDRNEAIQASKKLAHDYEWDLSGFDTACEFDQDFKLQAFIELEGGGKQAFIDMIDRKLYQPYTWNVRFYKPKEIKECTVSFTPEGQPYQFVMKLPENQAGASISRKQAEEIAQEAFSDWDIDIDQYDFVEYSSKQQPSNRIDHTFVYQRHSATLNAGLYRLKCVISGDRLTSIEHSVKIPDEFNRRFAQMFAHNTMLAATAKYIAIVLYVLIISCIILLFFYHDRRYLKIKQHGLLAFISACFSVAAIINQIPLFWKFYQTNFSPYLFALQMIVGAFIGALFFLTFVWVMLVVVDSVDRYMFGRHLQMLKVWSAEVAGSTQFFEMTMMGYFGAAMMLGYEGLYSLLSQYLGWWSPLYTLVNPNILATYVPCLSPLVSAFQAGFWEELVLRGLPLAGILFLARKSRHKAAWIMVAFILQALIFGALHANYPQMPFYYRLLELIIPSMFFGVLYWQYGLYAGMVMHFVYDAVLMCVPIWVSDLWIQKIICVLCIAAPLMIVMFFWIRQNYKLRSAPDHAYNDYEKYQAPVDLARIFNRSLSSIPTKKYMIGLFIFGLVGLIGLKYSKQPNFSEQPLSVSFKQAENIARSALQKENIVIPDDATQQGVLLSFCKDPDHRFIWNVYGAAQYQLLQSKCLKPLSWEISWKKFSGNVEDRAELWQILISVAGELIGLHHQLPQQRAGDDLSQDQAQQIASSSIERWYGLQLEDIELLSVETMKHPARRDYSFTFKNLKNYNLDQGYGQIIVEIAGSQLATITRSVHVPEQWQRTHDVESLYLNIWMVAGWVINLIFLLTGLLIAFRSLTFHKIFVKWIGIGAAIFAILNLTHFINQYHFVVSKFSTTEPWTYQYIKMFLSNITSALFLGLAFSVLLVLFLSYGYKSAHKKSWLAYISLIMTGIGLAGTVMFLQNYYIPVVPPAWCFESYHALSSWYYILIEYIGKEILLYSLSVMAISIIIQALHQRHKNILAVVVSFIFGLSLLCFVNLHNIPLAIGSGLLLGVLWYFLVRCVIAYDIESIFVISWVYAVVQFLPHVWYHSYPGIMSDWLATGAVSGLIIWLMYKKL